MLKTNKCLTVLISQWLQILILPVREQHLPFLKAEISNLYHAFLISEHRASSYKCWLMKSAIHLDSAIFLKCLLGFFHVSHSQSTHPVRFPIYCAFNNLLIEFLRCRLRSEIQHRRGIFLSQLKQPASDSLFLIFRQHQHFSNRTEEITICQNAQAAHQCFAVIGSNIQRFR